MCCGPFFLLLNFQFCFTWLRNDAEVICHGNAHVELNKPDYDRNDTILDEEEAAFLRSLGWVEDSGEDEEGLTEEEINAFYQEVSI